MGASGHGTSFPDFNQVLAILPLPAPSFDRRSPCSHLNGGKLSRRVRDILFGGEVRRIDRGLTGRDLTNDALLNVFVSVCGCPGGTSVRNARFSLGLGGRYRTRFGLGTQRRMAGVRKLFIAGTVKLFKDFIQIKEDPGRVLPAPICGFSLIGGKLNQFSTWASDQGTGPGEIDGIDFANFAIRQVSAREALGRNTVDSLDLYWARLLDQGGFQASQRNHENQMPTDIQGDSTVSL